MAYLLGYLYADGSLEDSPYIRAKYLRCTSTDQEAILLLKTFLKAEHPIVRIPPRTVNHKVKFFIRIGSHNLFDSLMNLGMTPHKSLTITMPDIPHKFLGDFLRGYFDGDGCVHIVKGKNKDGSLAIKKLTVILTSGSKKFLLQTHHALRAVLPIKVLRPLYPNQRAFQLRYSTADSVLLFKYFYQNARQGEYMTRKFDKFQEYFILRPQRVDKEVKMILNKASRLRPRSQVARHGSAKALYGGSIPPAASVL